MVSAVTEEPCERLLDDFALDAAGDENNAGTSVVVGPLGQAHRFMEQVLDAVHRDGAVLALDVDDTLDAQQILAVDRDQGLDPGNECLPPERPVEHQAMGTVPYAGHQFRIKGYDNGPRFPAPILGQHNEQVLREVLGMTEDEVTEAVIAEAIM